MQMYYEMSKGVANVFCNLLRHMSMTQIPTVKPIAFKFSTGSNPLTASNVVTNLLEFSSNIAGLNFLTDTQQEFIVCEYTYNKLTSDNLTKDGIVCLDKGVELLDAFDGRDFCIVIVYRNASGFFSDKQNMYDMTNAFSTDVGYNADEFVTISSNHNDISKFAFTIDDTDLRYDRISIDIETRTGRDNSFVLDRALNSIQETVNMLRNQF